MPDEEPNLGVSHLGRFEAVMAKVEGTIVEILDRIECPGEEKSARLKDRTVDVIKRTKKDLQKVKRERKEGLKKLKKWRKIAEHDTSLLFKGELTKESARYPYKDQRIFEVVIPDHLHRVLETDGQRRNVCLMQILIEEMGYIDADLAVDIASGFHTVGPHKETGVWEKDPKKAQPKREDVIEFYQILESTRDHGRKPDWMEDEVIEAVLQLILEDAKLGRFTEVSEEDLKAPPMLAFGIKQPGKIRQIVDERVKNLFSCFPERLKLSGLRHIREAIQAFMTGVGNEERTLAAACSQCKKDMFKRIEQKVEQRKETKSAGQEKKCGGAEVLDARKRLEEKLREFRKKRQKNWGSGSVPHIATKDWKKAYFQVGIAEPDLNPIKAWDTAKGGWRFFLACVLNMGNLHSVPSWCRIAEFTMHMMETLLVTVCLTYIDDSTLLTVEGDVDEAAQAFDELSEALGLVRSPKEESNMKSTTHSEMKILGLIFKRTGRMIEISVPKEKVERILKKAEEVVEAVLAKDLKYTDLAKVIGDVTYVTCAKTDRAGMQLLRPVYPLLCKDMFENMIKKKKMRMGIISTMRKVQLLARMDRPIEMTIENADQEWVWIYTDASTHGSASNGPRIGAVILLEDGTILRTESDKAPAGERIDFYEAAAVLLALRTFKNEISGKRAIIMVDNVVDCYAFVKASHKDKKTATVITQIILDMRKDGIAPYFDYILTEKNIADWTTRDELRCLFNIVGGVWAREPADMKELWNTQEWAQMFGEAGVVLSALPEGFGKPKEQEDALKSWTKESEEELERKGLNRKRRAQDPGRGKEAKIAKTSPRGSLAGT